MQSTATQWLAPAQPGSAVARNAAPSKDFAAKLARTSAFLIQIAADHGARHADAPSQITQASSLGAEDMVISHLINSLHLNVGIFVLETGQLHPQTLALLDELKASSRAPVNVFQPVAQNVVHFVAQHGSQAMYQSIDLRKACCALRKMGPLERALDGKTAWITGLRREQSSERAEVPLADTSDARRIKFNPLAHWTWGDVWHYIQLHQVAYNPLHDAFFPSIGCAPCTRAIAQGEDFRAGRWWWEDSSAKECGLHVAPVSQIEKPSEVVPA